MLVGRDELAEAIESMEESEEARILAEAISELISASLPD